MTKPDDKAISPCNSNACPYQAQYSTVEIDVNPNSRRLAFCETSVQSFHCTELCQSPGPPTPQISIAG
ncbi:hypothetical protein [Aliikangiella maris]|uniref:Uncharacterized protein n=2 Tax=Aliikangiella maris TaxID=3162458 RepID=A0ABV3MSV8_9GAMM